MKTSSSRTIGVYLPSKMVEAIEARMVTAMHAKRVGDGERVSFNGEVVKLLYKGLGITPQQLFAEELGAKPAPKKRASIRESAGRY